MGARAHCCRKAALAVQLSEVPAPPQRGELRERVAAVVAQSAAGWYEREVERLEHVFAAWQPASAGEIVEVHHE